LEGAPFAASADYLLLSFMLIAVAGYLRVLTARGAQSLMLGTSNKIDG
jgi:hypothetical protein